MVKAKSGPATAAPDHSFESHKVVIIEEMKKEGKATMTSAVYRKKLIKCGFPVHADQDVLHIIAKSLGKRLVMFEFGAKIDTCWGETGF